MKPQYHLMLTRNCTIFITLFKSFCKRPLFFFLASIVQAQRQLLCFVLFYVVEKLRLKGCYFKSNFFKKQRKLKITTRSCDIHQEKLLQENWFIGPTHVRHKREEAIQNMAVIRRHDENLCTQGIPGTSKNFIKEMEQ